MITVAAPSGSYRATPESSTDRVIRLSTAAAVLAVAGIAAYVSYWHAYAVTRAHGESGITAQLEPATIDGLVYASSMVILYAARHRVPVPPLARWLLGLGITATLTPNMAQGRSHGLVGAMVAASLVGSYELLVWLIPASGGGSSRPDSPGTVNLTDLADASARWSPRHDLVFLIECGHDFRRPPVPLRHARAAVRPGGRVLVVDERAAEGFTVPGETGRFCAAASAIWCQPPGRVGPGPEAAGILIRPAAIRDFARTAGYAGAGIVPTGHRAWRFGRLAS